MTLTMHSSVHLCGLCWTYLDNTNGGSRCHHFLCPKSVPLHLRQPVRPRRCVMEQVGLFRRREILGEALEGIPADGV